MYLGTTPDEIIEKLLNEFIEMKKKCKWWQFTKKMLIQDQIDFTKPLVDNAKRAKKEFLTNQNKTT